MDSAYFDWKAAPTLSLACIADLGGADGVNGVANPHANVIRPFGNTLGPAGSGIAPNVHGFVETHDPDVYNSRKQHSPGLELNDLAVVNEGEACRRVRPGSAESDPRGFSHGGTAEYHYQRDDRDKFHDRNAIGWGSPVRARLWWSRVVGSRDQRFHAAVSPTRPSIKSSAVLGSGTTVNCPPLIVTKSSAVELPNAPTPG